MTTNYDVGYLTDVGKVREANEDNYAVPPTDLPQVTVDQKGFLYFVADGMGGHKGGQQASGLAKQMVMDAYYRAPSQDVRQSLEYAIREANTEIHRQSQTNPIFQGMGTTIVAAVVQSNRLVIAHVGDSRAYLIRQGTIQPLTQDHSFIAEGLRDGTIAPDEVNTHPYRGVITRALGGKADVQPDFTEIALHQDDAILLCSDGLSNMVSDQELLAIVEKSGSAQGAVQEMASLANQRGGPDNITAIVLNWRQGAAVAKKPIPILPYAVAGSFAVIALIAIFAMWSPLGSRPSNQAVALASLTPAPVTGTATEEVIAISGETVEPSLDDGGETPNAEPPAQTGEPAGNVTLTSQPEQTVTPMINPESVTPTSTPVPVTPTQQPQPPTATPKPAKPSPTPSRYRAPIANAPADGSSFNNRNIQLVWDWEGSLKEDEYFDIRIWRENDEYPFWTDWATNKSYFLNLDNEPSGKLLWSVRVIKGHLEEGEQKMDEVRSDDSERRAINWSKSSPPTPTPKKEGS